MLTLCRYVFLILLSIYTWQCCLAQTNDDPSQIAAPDNTVSQNFYQTTLQGIPITGTQTPNAFDQRFTIFIKRWRIPGASVAVMRNGNLVLTRGYGWADLTNKKPVLPDSLFRIGSVYKTITAVTVLKLAEEQRIRLDDKVFQVLNDLRPLNHRHNPLIFQITVRDLLQMASGWQTNVIDPMFGPWTMHMLNQLADFNDELPPNCETAARLMMGVPLKFKPGTQFSYSNINYCLLGLITNKVTGNSYNYQNYEAYVKQHVLAPIGVTNMKIGDTLFQNRAPNEVKYYSYVDITPNPHDLDSELVKIDGLPYSNTQILKKNFSDGGWIASAPELAKFLQAINYHQILSPRMVGIMLQRPNYKKKNDGGWFAMGWSVKNINNRRYWYKTGSFTGTYALVMQGADGTSYVALFNTKPPNRVEFLAQLRRILVTSA
jgi:N-acyl-D-amino-acid deacylase